MKKLHWTACLLLTTLNLACGSDNPASTSSQAEKNGVSNSQIPELKVTSMYASWDPESQNSFGSENRLLVGAKKTFSYRATDDSGLDLRTSGIGIGSFSSSGDSGCNESAIAFRILWRVENGKSQDLGQQIFGPPRRSTFLPTSAGKTYFLEITVENDGGCWLLEADFDATKRKN